MSKVSIIAAVDRHMAIGFENKLLFWLPNDLKRFKALTTGNHYTYGTQNFRVITERRIAQSQKYRFIFQSGYSMSRCGSFSFTQEAALKSCREVNTSIL